MYTKYCKADCTIRSETRTTQHHDPGHECWLVQDWNRFTGLMNGCAQGSEPVRLLSVGMCLSEQSGTEAHYKFRDGLAAGCGEVTSCCFMSSMFFMTGSFLTCSYHVLFIPGYDFFVSPPRGALRPSDAHVKDMIMTNNESSV